MLAGLCGDVDGSSHTPFKSCLKDSVVLGVDSQAWELVVISSGWGVRITEFPTGASPLITMKLSGWNSIVPLPYHLVILDYHSADLTSATG